MKTKGSKSLHFNNLDWDVFQMGEKVILLECSIETAIEHIHQSDQLIRDILGKQLDDIVPAYNSITIFTNLSLEDVCSNLQDQVAEDLDVLSDNEIIQIPICYELEQDLDRVSQEVGLSKNEIIDRHLKGIYRVVFIGFTPGFVYADGLDELITCPRLDNPRKMVAAGSVGIGGSQTGIYSLSSPGGWNIIGQTPIALFDKQNQPPMRLEVGISYQFFRVNKKEFSSWEG